MYLLKLKDAKKNYLNISFDLTVNKGDLIIISGTNGTGKSTLIKMIIGYIKPDTGYISKKIKKITYLSEQQVMPEFFNSNTYLKELMRMKRGEYDRKLYYEFNIPNKPIKELSKGNRQKLAIVGALIGKTDLYVFDEPLSGLDNQSVKIFSNKIKALQEEGCSVVIATHNKKAFSKLQYIDISL